MIRSARLRVAVAALLCASLAAGCGSTVHQRARAKAGAGNDTTAGIDDGSGAAADTAGGSSDAAASGGRATTGGRRATSAAAKAAALAQQPGPGVSTTSINVGITEIENAEAVNQAAGVGAVTRGDPNAYAEAVLDDINKHGGAAGRKLAPVWHVRDATSTETIEAQDEKACNDWTRDHKVFAVMGASSDSFQACATKAHVIQVDDNVAAFDASVFQRYPGFFELCCPSLDRIAAAQVTALVSQKYFTPWDLNLGAPGTGKPRVGILTLDDIAFKNAVTRVLIPGLTRAGYAPEVEYVTKPDASSELSQQAATIQAAELKFRSNGVSHVIIFEQAGTLSLLFLQYARSQHYFPRYGTNSNGFFEGLIENKYASPEQFNGTMGFGWIPPGDLPASRNPDDGPYSNPTRRHCIQIMKADGQTFSSPNAELVALLFCDELYFLRDVLNRTGPIINATTFIAAAESLGSAFDSGAELGEFFGPGRHDGVSRAYFWNYFSDCNCMHYDGPLREI